MALTPSVPTQAPSEGAIQDFTRPYFLTIYILAYENADCIRELLGSLLPLEQPGACDACVVVADNSDKTRGVREAVGELSPRFAGRLVHHSYGCNIGLGTLVRPFEIVRSKYLWMVGACNRFRPGALATLLPALKQREPDVLLHAENNLYRRNWVQVEQTYEAPLDLMRAHSHSIVCSINSAVHSLEKMRPLLTVGFEAASSLVPQAAMIYEGLRLKQIKVLYLPMMIFERLPRPRSWSTRAFIENMHCMFPAATPRADREAFFREVTQTDPWLLEDIKHLQANPD
jgi:hypothetical protein